MQIMALARFSGTEFEKLTYDLLFEREKVRYEIFTPGRDGGIDLRYVDNQQFFTLVQCKQMMESGYPKLKSSLKKEFEKCVELNPDRYMLYTSVALTPGNKKEIKEIFRGYIKSDSDIVGRDEIDAILSSNHEIVRRHPKLWFPGADFLDEIVNKYERNQSAALVTEISGMLTSFAPSESFFDAIAMLEEKNACILTGDPGVGKTTVAQAVAAKYLKDGYKIIDVSGDIDNANLSWHPDQRQFFYFDDFLGQTRLFDITAKNQDSKIHQFLNRVTNTPGKKIVFTSREYIIQQGRELSERVNGKLFSDRISVLNLNQYRMKTRAKILVALVWRAGLSRDCRRIFADRRYYPKVLGHRNFNPRLIDASLSEIGVTEKSGHLAFDRVLQMLDTPEEVWGHMFSSQMTLVELNLSFALLLSPQREADFDNVLTLWNRLVGHAIHPIDQSRVLRTLEGVVIHAAAGSIRFSNPSIVDYLRHSISSNSIWFSSLVRSIESVQEFEAFVSNLLPAIKAQDNGVDLTNQVASKLYSSLFGTFGSDLWARFLLSILELEEKLKDSVFSDFCTNLLDVDIARTADDPDLVVAVYKSVSGSSNAKVPEYSADVQRWGINSIRWHVSDWQDGLQAQDFYSDLDAGDCAEAIEVELEMREIATRAASSIEFGESSGDWDSYELSRMRDFLADYQDEDDESLIRVLDRQIMIIDHSPENLGGTAGYSNARVANSDDASIQAILNELM